VKEKRTRIVWKDERLNLAMQLIETPSSMEEAGNRKGRRRRERILCGGGGVL